LPGKGPLAVLAVCTYGVTTRGKAEPFLLSGLLEDRGGALVPTERGMLLLNELVLALV
jgi:hypothetical protein